MSIEQYTENFKKIRDRSELQMILLDLAKHMPDNYALRTNKNYLYGCQSDVWLTGNCYNDRWRFNFDSDSLMVKGIGKIVLDCVNNLTSNEIRNLNYFSFKKIAVFLPYEKQRGLQFIINRIHAIIGSTS
jgi:cysteine desulfuration protein SufE